MEQHSLFEYPARENSGGLFSSDLAVHIYYWYIASLPYMTKT